MSSGINVLQSYLIKLGFSPPDEASYRKLVGMMAGAEASVTSSVGGMAKHLLEAQGAIVGVFTSISGAIIGMADHVAMSDQRYRLMGEKMMMTTRSARELDMITKALGADLGEIVWDKELHQRAIILDQDFKRMSASMGGGFEGNMKGIRDIRFEFSRLQMGLEFFTMSFAGGLFKNLMPGDAGKKIQDWVTWFQDNASRLGEEWAKRLVPVLKETWLMMGQLWEVAKGAGTAFINLAGLLSGDASLKGAEFSFENIARSIEHVGDWMVKFFGWIADAEKVVAHFAAGMSFLLNGDINKAGAEFKIGISDLNLGSGAVLVAALGGLLVPIASLGTSLGSVGGAILGLSGPLEALTIALGVLSGIMLATQKPGTLKDAGEGFIHWLDKDVLGDEKSGIRHFLGYTPDAKHRADAEDQAAIDAGFSKSFVARRRAAGIYGTSENPMAPAVKAMEGDLGLPHITIMGAPPVPTGAGGTTQQVILGGKSAPPAAGIQSQADLIERMAAAITKQENTKSNPRTAPNNNPGNLRSWGDRPIVNGFAQFPDWETGMAALREQIRKNIALGLDLQEFFTGKTAGGKEIYPGYDKTLPTYADIVGKQLNIPTDVPLAQIPAATSAQAAPIAPPVPARGVSWVHSAADEDLGARPAGWDGAAAQPAARRDWFVEPPQWYGQAPGEAAGAAPAAAGAIPTRIPVVQAPAAWGEKAPEWMRSLTMQSDTGESFPLQMQQQAVMPAGAPGMVRSEPHFTVNVGGINIMQPGADAQQINRAVENGVRTALTEQVQHDLLQLQSQW